MPYTAATTTIDAVNHVLNFDTEGYYIVGDREWQDITATVVLTYNSGMIGFVPRLYDDNMYMTLKLQNREEEISETETLLTGYATLDVMVGANPMRLGEASFFSLVPGQSYTLKAEIKRTNYKIYLDGALIINIEYGAMDRGKVGAYSTQGNTCSLIEVEAYFGDAWTTNVDSVTGAIAHIRELSNEDKVLYLENPIGSTVDLYAEQEFNVEEGQDYVLSFDINGELACYIEELNGATPVIREPVDGLPHYASDWMRFNEQPFKVSAGCTRLKVKFTAPAGKTGMLNNVQFEKKSFATGYIHNDSTIEPMVRENSIITYPSKNNIKPNKGSVSMYVKPLASYTGKSFVPVLFEYGDTERIQISYDGTSFSFKYGNGTVTKASSFDQDVWYNITASWSGTSLAISVDGIRESTSGDFVFNGQSEVIRIGHTNEVNKHTFFGVIDETIILTDYITDDEVTELYQATEPVANKDSMVLRATFNYAIANFNKSMVEMTLAPKYGSPIVIEKEDGTPMQKVSFFDYQTGAYRTWNQERVFYDKILDYIQVSYSKLDTENFKIQVLDEKGSIIGDPYTIKGNRIHLTLTEDQKKSLHNYPLFVSYQVEDAFTVDFNIGVPDSFRVNVGKHDGQQLKITYEGNDFQDHKLATMIEMNPLLNANHEGFLYITRNREKVTSFRIRMTPEDLPADGVSEALVVVEPLDVNGNFISHAKLMTTAEHGRLIPNYDRGSVLSRERSGRYLYKYRPNLIHKSEVGASEILDYINIIDEETKLGVQIPVTLTTIEVISHIIDEDDTAASIAEAYGTTMEDLIEANDQFNTVNELKAYIENSVGSGISIPLNYLNSILRKKRYGVDEEPYEEMAVYVFNNIMDHMGKLSRDLPEGLAAILDFNTDGKINMDEIDWLEEHLHTAELSAKVEQLKTWHEQN